jgi:glucokinase
VPARFVIGVDLGGTKLLAGAVDEELAVRYRASRPVFGIGQAELVEMCVQAVDEARGAVGGAVDAVGMGIPCTFDRRTGLAVQAVNLPLADLPFAEVMTERLGLPVVVDNDGNCSALAEARHGVGRGSADLVMLTIGTGIGSGMVLGGQLYRGWIGGGAEIGHMVVDMDGPPCQGNCPNWGCLESVASGNALVREVALRVARRPDTALGRALESGVELTGPLVTELAYEGDPVARDAIHVVGERLGVGIANVVNIFNPEVVAIGGGVIAAGELLLEPARAVMMRRALAPAREVVRVEAAAFGAEAGMVGAAVLAREELVSGVGFADRLEGAEGAS